VTPVTRSYREEVEEAATHARNGATGARHVWRDAAGIWDS